MEKEIIEKEINYQTSRSGGSGGQHVNKVETKVTLRFDLANSEGLSQKEKEQIFAHLKARINNNGEIVLEDQQSRSQVRNKRTVTIRFFTLLEKALQRHKKRKGAPILRADPRKRLEGKKRHSEKKAARKKIRPQDL